MAPRMTYAAKTFAQQVRNKYPDAYIENGHVDGLGVYRSLRFEAEVADWLAPIVNVLNDPRITGGTYTDDGTYVVAFSSRTIADRREPFEIEAIDVILNAAVEPAVEPVPKPKKRAAKKTVKPDSGT